MRDEELAVERDALIAEIYDAFADVSRKGAVSWSEARVIDRYGWEAERKRARKSDWEANWQGLVDAADWPGDYGSEWSFLDALGFRYYLAPALIRWLKNGDDGEVLYSLWIPENGDYGRRFLPTLDLRQKHCVRRAIEYHLALEDSEGLYARKTLQSAYDSYWSSLPDQDE